MVLLTTPGDVLISPNMRASVSAILTSTFNACVLTLAGSLLFTIACASALAHTSLKSSRSASSSRSWASISGEMESRPNIVLPCSSAIRSLVTCERQCLRKESVERENRLARGASSAPVAASFSISPRLGERQVLQFLFILYYRRQE